MKRKIAAVALCAVMVSSMVAPTVSVKAADKEKLIVAYKDSDSTGAKYMEQWINSTYENWADKIQVEMQDKDTCPDIFFEDTFQLNTDVAAGYVADITDKVNAWDEWDSSFIEALKEGTKGSDGQTYASGTVTSAEVAVSGTMNCASGKITVTWKYTVPSLDGDGNEVEGEIQTKTETVEV